MSLWPLGGSRGSGNGLPKEGEEFVGLPGLRRRVLPGGGGGGGHKKELNCGGACHLLHSHGHRRTPRSPEGRGAGRAPRPEKGNCVLFSRRGKLGAGEPRLPEKKQAQATSQLTGPESQTPEP